MTDDTATGICGCIGDGGWAIKAAEVHVAMKSIIKHSKKSSLFMLRYICIISCVFISNTAWAADYSVALVSVGPANTPVVSNGINASGEVTGYAAGSPAQAFIFQNGAGTLLSPGGAGSSIGTAINGEGTVAGYFYATSTSISQQGFTYSAGERTVVSSPDGDVDVRAINSGGAVAGVRYNADGTNGQAFVAYGGSIQYIGTLPGATGSFANGINDAGQVVGEAFLSPDYDHRAFLYTNGEMTDLGTLGGPISSATAINNAGQIVGWASLSNTVTYSHGGLGLTFNASHAFLYGDRTMLDLGTLGGYGSKADAINDSGDVVGWSEYLMNDYDQHAFLYAHGTMIDLNSVIDSNSGWVLQEATGINSSGQITGNGLLNGQAEAFLLTPGGGSGFSIGQVPEAGTVGMLAGAGVVLVRRRGRK